MLQLQWKSACISTHQLGGSGDMPPPPKKIRCPRIGHFRTKNGTRQYNPVHTLRRHIAWVQDTAVAEPLCIMHTLSEVSN